METVPGANGRLLWRMRRGLLENDILLGRWLQGEGGAPRPADLEPLARVLDLPDQELLDLLLGRIEPPAALGDEPARDLIERLRRA